MCGGGAVLRLDHVRLRVGDFQIRADQIDLTSNIYAVLGPSGAGKSTLLSAIAGFLTPVQGSILWNDDDITRTPPAQRPVGMVFQDNNLFPHLSLYRNVALAVTHKSRLTREQDEKVRRALDRVGLQGLGDRRPAQVSGGQNSRAALARVLIQGRPIMALDEPFAALGPALKTEMLDLVAELAHEHGTLVLMVTHDPNDARRIAPKTIMVADGQIHAAADTAQLLDNPPESLAQYLGNFATVKPQTAGGNNG